MKGPYASDIKTYVGRPNGNRCQTWETNTWYRTDDGIKQRVPLPWARLKSYVTAWPYGDDSATQADSVSCVYYAQQTWGRDNDLKGWIWSSVDNRAYAKLLDKIRSDAGVGQNIAEYKQSLKLLHGAIDVIKSPLKTFAKAVQSWFRKNKDATARTPLKQMGDAWLIWHFGVEPLIKDLHSVMERLESSANFTWTRHTASSKGQRRFRYNTGKLPNQWFIDETYMGVRRYSLEVRYTNPSLALMNDFGIVNPASLAWELVPFSFVIDWFYPIGSYLNSFTDLLGYETRNPSNTFMLTWLSEQGYVYDEGFSAGKFNGVRISRSLTNPSFSLPRVEIPAGLSPTRGATAIALLLQVLKAR